MPVRQIRIVGSTVFTPEQLAEVAAPYVNRELTAEDFEALRVALTLLYVNRGYINSGAVIPDQTLTDGVFMIQIIEGLLSQIDVEGTRWFRPFYLRKRLALGAGPPLDTNELQEQIQYLLEDPRIARLNVELKPGAGPGTSVLSVTVEERPPYRLWGEFNNYQSPSVGAERWTAAIEHLNLLGLGDVLTVRYGESKGVNVLLDARYAVPLTPHDTTLILQYRKNDFTVIEKPLDTLKISSDTEIVSITLRQPVFRTLNHRVAVELTGEWLTNRTFLGGDPFSLSAGARNGESTVTALRIAPEWIYRTQTDVVAVRMRFSAGVDALGATINEGNGPDGKFLAWQGQAQYVRRIAALRDTQVLLRADVQLTGDSLLSLEQVAIGGRYSVRGYRENTLVRDNGAVVSAEARVPILRQIRWLDYLELAPFVDGGRAWNARTETDPRSLSSVGIGLRAGVTLPMWIPLRSQFEIYWGHRLRDVPTSGNDLQDKGVHLQVVVGAF